eukprot:1259413-Rhodomonas_salina.1
MKEVVLCSKAPVTPLDGACSERGREGGMGCTGREGRGEEMRHSLGEEERGVARNGALGERRGDGKQWGAH